MMERRQHPRKAVDCWARLKHPLLGAFSARVDDLSMGGLSLVPDENSFFFIMMEVEVCIQGEGWDDSMPALTAQVVRIDKRRVGLKFLETADDFWWQPEEQEFEMLWSEVDDLVIAI